MTCADGSITGLVAQLPLHHIFMHSDRTTGVKRVMTLAQLSHDFGITQMPASAPKKRDEDPVGILSVVISRVRAPLCSSIRDGITGL